MRRVVGERHQGSIILRLRLFVHAHELRLHLLAQRARETNGVERDVEFAGVRAAVETERRGGIGARGGGERDAGRARATAAGGRGGRRAREGVATIRAHARAGEDGAGMPAVDARAAMCAIFECFRFLKKRRATREDATVTREAREDGATNS